MAEFLAYRIACDKCTFKQVPKTLKSNVADCLKDLDAADLITEDEYK